MAPSPQVVLFLVLVWMNVFTGPVVKCLAAEPGVPTEGEAPSPSTAVLAPDVVVTATRTRQPVAHVPAAPTILTRDQIERTPFADGHQVDDLVRYVPGVQPSNLSSRYNHPTAQAVTLRGLGSRRALVLLDGVPLNDGFGGWINWGLAPDNLERIEVVPGGGSNLYGTWAMGGIIHLITQQPVAGKGLRAESSAGNLNTYTQALSGRYGTDRLGISLGYRWYHTNGFITVPEYQRGPVDGNDDSRHQHFTGTLAAALGARTKASLSGTLFREDRNFGTPLSVASRTIGTMALAFQGDTRRGDHWETRLFAQWQTFRNSTGQVIPSPTNRSGEFLDRIQVIPSNDLGGQAQWTVSLTPRHRVVVGTDARAILGQSEEQLFTMAGLVGNSLAAGKQVGWGVFGEWIARPTEALTVIPSFRTDWWKSFDGRIESAQGTITRPRDNVALVLNPKLAAQYRVTDRITAGASVYQAFRAPTLNELYRGFSFGGFTFLPNENLEPERSIGGEGKLEGELLQDGKLTWRATGHYDEVKDQILLVTQGPVIALRQNVGRTRTVGGELDLRFRASAQVSLNIGYAFADSVIKSFPGSPTLVGKRVPNVSRHQVAIGLTLGHPDWVEVTMMGRYLSQQFANDLNTQPIADFVVLDASVQKRVGKLIRLFLNGENLTDRQYIATQTGSIKTLGAPLLVMGGLRFDY